MVKVNNTQPNIATASDSLTQKGYKQTELGLVPINWEIKRLQEISYICSGGTPSRKNPLYWEGNIPWITTSQIDFNTILEANEFITEDGLKNSAAKIFDKGTLVLAMYGQGKTRGKIAILGIQATTNQACAAICLNRDISNSFIFYNLAYRYEEVRTLSNSGSQENLNGEIIKKIKVLLPPLHEQNAISKALIDADALINAIDALITKKRQIKQGVMQQLLSGETRLLGFLNEWQTKRLGEIVDIVNGGTPSTNDPKLWDGDIKWCTPTDITNNKDKYLYHTERTISKIGLDNSSATLLPIGTLLLCSRATIGELKIAQDILCTNQGFKSLVCKKGISNEFLYYLLIYSKQKFIEKASGSTFLEISKNDTSLIEFKIPNLKEQQSIASILGALDLDIFSLEDNLRKYKNLKQGLMQELLTGKTRLL